MPETNNITDSLVDLDEQSEAEKLLCEIDEFRERTGMPETTFGSKAVNNPEIRAASAPGARPSHFDGGQGSPVHGRCRPMNPFDWQATTSSPRPELATLALPAVIAAGIVATIWASDFSLIFDSSLGADGKPGVLTDRAGSEPVRSFSFSTLKDAP